MFHCVGSYKPISTDKMRIFCRASYESYSPIYSNVMVFILELLIGWTLLSIASSEFQYEDGQYYAYAPNMTEVPTDIPREATLVNLEYNEISALRKNDFFHLTQCTRLELGHNSIAEIEAGAFLGLNELDTLELDHNQLTSVRGDMWEGLVVLQRLVLSWNNIKVIPEHAWTGLSSLKVLDLGPNDIAEIAPRALEGLENLESLILFANDIKTVNDTMLEGLTSLKDLNLNDNDLNFIAPGTFSNLPNLESLAIPNNELTTVSLDMFRSIGHPAKLELLIHANPFYCDERLCWLKEGEKEGWLDYDSRTQRYAPSCSNHPGVHWNDINLGCKEK